jgi:hypothetical protein
VGGDDELRVQIEEEVEASRGFCLVDVAGEDEVGGVMIPFAFDERGVEGCESGIEVCDGLGEDLELLAASAFDEGARDEVVDDLMAPPFSDLGHHGADPGALDGGGKGYVAFSEQIEDLVEVLEFLDGDAVEFAGGVAEFDVFLEVDGGGGGFAFEVGVIDEDTVELLPNVFQPSVREFSAPEEHGGY